MSSWIGLTGFFLERTVLQLASGSPPPVVLSLSQVAKRVASLMALSKNDRMGNRYADDQRIIVRIHWH